ncbi:hypothetical protein LINPERHAP1_LOCUS16811 [Linum perenne]
MNGFSRRFRRRRVSLQSATNSRKRLDGREESGEKGCSFFFCATVIKANGAIWRC